MRRGAWCGRLVLSGLLCEWDVAMLEGRDVVYGRAGVVQSVFIVACTLVRCTV